MRILFVGNSHTYFNDMPETFAELWQGCFGDKPDVTMLAYSTRTLQWHSDEYFALRFNLLYGKYDVCVIQQLAHPFPGYEETLKGIQTILRLCREAKTKPYLYMPWCEKKYPENQEKITTALRQIATEEQISTVPIGDVWQEFQKREPSVSLYWTDGGHASVVGDYLIAVTMCMTISDRTDICPPAITHDFHIDGTIDFDHPILNENAETTYRSIPENIATTIIDSARTILTN